MLTINDFRKYWFSTELQSVPHPAGFDENNFLLWWYGHFDDIQQAYHVYILYLIIHHNRQAEDFPGICREKIKQLANQAGVTIGGFNL